MIAGTGEVAVVGGAFLVAIGRAHARVHVEHDALRRTAAVHPVDPSTGEIGEHGEVLIIREPLRLEPAHLAGGGCLLRCSTTANDPAMRWKTVGFIVTNMTRPAERVVAFYNQRGTAEQWIKEGKNAIKWTRLSCFSFAANAVRLQLHALAYNLANFMRTLALSEAVKQWSLTSLREKLVKIGAKIVTHARYVIFQICLL